MAVYSKVTLARAMASIQFFSWAGTPKLYIGTPSTSTSAAWISAITASSMATRAACSGLRCSTGVNRACRAGSSSSPKGARPRSRTVTVASSWVARMRSTMVAARRLECEASGRELELICRMFMVSPSGRGLWKRWTHCNYPHRLAEALGLDNIVPLVEQWWRR